MAALPTQPDEPGFMGGLALPLVSCRQQGGAQPLQFTELSSDMLISRQGTYADTLQPGWTLLAASKEQAPNSAGARALPVPT